MYEEAIEFVLRFCKRNISFFLVSKTFERIYLGVIYSPEVSNKLFKIACYENDKLMIEMLTSKQLIKLDKEKEELIDFWKRNLSNESFEIDWDTLNFGRFCCLDEIINIEVKKYCDELVLEEHSIFGYKLLDHFMLMKDKLIINEWKYKFYEIRHEVNLDYNYYYDYEYAILLDHKFNNFLMVGSKFGHPDIICNEFAYINSHGSGSDLQGKGRNLNVLFKRMSHYYNLCMNM